MQKRSSKPKDLNSLAAAIVSDATAESHYDTARAKQAKNPAAVALGRLGGLKGGNARAANLTGSKRIAIARMAARARWSKKRKKP